MNRQPVRRAPEIDRSGQTGEAENVIQMAVGQQDPVQSPESDSASHELALRSLAAIDQIAAPFVLDEQCREPALRAGYARRRPEEGGLQHRGTPRSGPPRRPSRLA